MIDEDEMVFCNRHNLWFNGFNEQDCPRCLAELARQQQRQKVLAHSNLLNGGDSE